MSLAACTSAPSEGTGAQAIDGLCQGHAVDAVPRVDDQAAELRVGDQLHGAGTERGAQDTVEMRRAAAALQVTEDDVARFLAGALLDLGRDFLADAAQANLAIGGLADGRR